MYFYTRCTYVHEKNEYDTVLALALSEYIPKSIKNERTYRPQPVSNLQ